jgi:hypothetical protein
LRKLLSLLLVLAFAARCLVPAGYMLAPASADGDWSVVVCTGHGPLRIDFDGNPPDAPVKGDVAACAFATIAAFALPSLDLLPTPQPAGEPQRLAIASSVVSIPRTSPPLPARGPPVLS